jgi:hypothetical protein
MEIKMKRTSGLVLLVGLFIFSAFSGLCLADYKPWDDLSGDNWIEYEGVDPNMYPVNAADDGDVEVSYPISFLPPKLIPETIYYKGGGMNALRFFNGGEFDGHFVSRNKSGSFVIGNTGDSNNYSDILLLIAIDADSLPGDFSMTINLAGHSPYTLDAADFVNYNSPFGRPSGFCSLTDPSVEPISYAFDTGMVTVYGVSGLSSLNQADKDNPYPYDTITIEYSFDYVPAPVVFSVYGYVGTDDYSVVYHTNRGSIDVNNNKKKVSTFAVTVEGDLNGDLKVNLEDLTMMAESWLFGV